MKKKHKTIYDLLGMNTSSEIQNEVVQDINNYFKESINSKSDDSFSQLILKLTLFLKQYSPVDVIVAINILELWLPNISASFKQSILVNTYLSIPENEFTCIRTLDTYDEFQEFSSYIIVLFPDFPMMEDYVPELDWGEVKFQVEGHYYDIFYGGCIERIPDFLQAFIIAYADNPKAIASVKYALKVQDYIINKLRHIVVIPDGIERGYMEVPKENFWYLCKNSITEVSQTFNDVASEFIINIGHEKSYSNVNDFSTAFMQSQVNQGLLVKISNRLLPFSIRNYISVVIDRVGSVPVSTSKASYELAKFINQRITTASELPLQLFDSKRLYPSVVTSVFHHLDKFYFIIILDDDEDTSQDFESYLQESLQSDCWGFKKIGSPYAFNIRNEGDDQVPRSQIEILYLVSQVSTSMGLYPIPKSGTIFPLSEFISIIDSIESISEFVRFLNFMKDHKEKTNTPMISTVDKFAIFKDSNGVLEKGAINYHQVFIDPHSGSNWRYKYLADYWKNLIVDFPDKASKWIPKNSYDGIQTLAANDGTKFTWSTKILNTTIHFLVKVDEFISLHPINGRMLNFFAESTADALSQRRDIISKLNAVTQYQTIVFTCCPDTNYLRL